MGNKTPATTTQNQTGTSVSDPWSAATPLLQSLISKYSGLSTDPTAAQTTATNNLVSAAGATPSYGTQGASAVNSTFNNAGMLNSAFGTLQNNLGADASGANLDPMSTPGLSDALSKLNNDITASTKGVFAGSGRDPSGAGDFAKTLATGLAQGEAPVITNQFNQNKANQYAANNALFSGAGSTVSGNAANTTAALQQAGILPTVATAPATAQVGAANTQQALPYQNLLEQLQAAGMLGGMGGTTNTTQSGTATQTPANNPLMNWLGGISAGAGLVGAFSDERLKTDIKDVGRTHDGQKIYSYRFKGGNVPQIGMLAGEVEKKHPHAVGRAGGFKTVRYDLATRKAARMGMLEDRKAA